MKGKRKLTPRAWAGLLATPVLAIAVLFALGVAGATAGPTTADTAAAAADVTPVTHAARQTVSQVEAYWTPALMAAAEPYPMPTKSGSPSTPAGTLVPMAEPSGAPGAVAGALPGGVALPQPAAQEVGSSQEPQHHAYLTQVPYTRWSTIGRYDKFPNYAILKMFFSQDDDGDGSVGNFVCSASAIGVDAAWTAGHCLSNNTGLGANAGWSSNVLVCPVYDNGFVHGHGCWSSDLLAVPNAWRAGGGGNVDWGGIDTSANGTVIPGELGAHTGWLGFAWNQSRDQHWTAMGYPAGPPFAGGKMIMASSGYGYDDDWSPDAVLGVAMGSDLTGGSSGGPWILQYGLTGQVGGLGSNLVNGHNDWRWTGGGVPQQMVSPYYDCRVMQTYNAVNGTSHCP